MIKLHFLLKALKQKSDRLHVIGDSDGRMTSLLRSMSRINRQIIHFKKPPTVNLAQRESTDILQAVADFQCFLLTCLSLVKQAALFPLVCIKCVYFFPPWHY